MNFPPPMQGQEIPSGSGDTRQDGAHQNKDQLEEKVLHHHPREEQPEWPGDKADGRQRGEDLPGDGLRRLLVQNRLLQGIAGSQD